MAEFLKDLPYDGDEALDSFIIEQEICSSNHSQLF